MRDNRVRVPRERPTVLAWSIALAVTMLAVYATTWTAARPNETALAFASPRVTRRIDLSALEGWCVALGPWEDASRARVEAAGFASRGAAGRVWQADQSWFVLGALYGNEKQARRSAERLSDEGLPAEALPLSANAVALRITAPEVQIDRIVAADALLRDQVNQLGTLARQLDAGQLRPEAAMTLCSLAATEAASLADGLRAASQQPLCAHLVECLDGLAAELSDVAGKSGSSPAALSGMIRLAAIDTFLQMTVLQNALSG